MTLFIVLLLVGCPLFQETAGELFTSHLRTTNMDVSFGRWTKGTAVPYCFDTTSPLTSSEQLLVTNTLNSLGTALGSCMTFTKLTDCTGSTYKLRFQALTDGSPSNAFPGVKLSIKNGGGTDQIIGLARDATNCPNDPRCIMKQAVITLGKRNEHERGDRNSFIDVNIANVIAQYTDLFKVYNSTTAYWSTYPYDYCSITHNKMTDYAQPGTMAFTVKNAPYCIPELPTISKTDCLLISRLYSCSLTACDALPECSTATCPTTTPSTTTSTSTTTVATTTPTAATTSTVSATTTAPTTASTATSTATSTTTSSTTSTTTTATTTVAPPCVDFCLETTTINEASKLFNGNYYMFSGDCMVQIDATNKLIGPSVKISTILPGITGPVTSVWSDKRSVSYVQTSTMEYVCYASSCQSISPIPAADLPIVRWEGSGSVTYSYFPSYPSLGPIYFNDLIDSYAYSTNVILCGAGTQLCLMNAAKWSAAYSISVAGLQLTNVIGMDLATGNQRMFMTMIKSDIIRPGSASPGGIGTGTADDYDVLNLGTPLTPLLGCPNAAAG